MTKEEIVAKVEALIARATREQGRANMLADKCGELEDLLRIANDERQEVLAENARLRRELERLSAAPARRTRALPSPARK